MSVRLKLVIIIVFVALLPLSVLSYTTLGLHTRAYDDQLAALQLKSAQYGAKVVQSHLDGVVASFATLVVGSIDWPALSPQERQGALWLVYAQHPSVLAVSLVDNKGATQEPIVYVADSTREQAADHPVASPQSLARFGVGIPLQQTLASGRAIGNPFALEDGNLALPLGFAVDGAVLGERMVLAVALSLATACEELAAARPADAEQYLLDAQGRTLCPEGRVSAGRTVFAAPMQTSNETTKRARYVDADGRDLLGTRSATFGTWQVLVQQVSEVALAPSARIRQQSLVWIAAGVLAALGAGFVLARAINRPIEQLARGAAELAQGRFDYRLQPEGEDEFARLSTAFNVMGTEIAKRDTEIRRWNEELQQRVDQRTAELKQAQKALLESRKIAAMASLGAGIAHEINNPLTGVIGITQILKGRAKKREGGEKEAGLLQNVETEALRIRDIVQKMLSLSDDQRGEGLTPLKLPALIEHVIAARREALDRARVEVVTDFGGGSALVLGDTAQLTTALGEIVDNALKAMQGDVRRLSITIEALDDELLRVRVTDTGKGIAPEHIEKVFEPFFTTKDDWSGEGLGLTTAYRIVEGHRGTLKVESALGRGTSMTITLPIARQGSHLV